MVQSLERRGGPSEFGRIIGQGTGEGLSSLLEGIAAGKAKKLEERHKHNEVEKRKLTYEKAGLPTWLAELPEDTQGLLLKEYDMSPQEKFSVDHVTPEQKEQIRQYMSNPESLKAHTEEEISKLQRYLNPQPQQQEYPGLTNAPIEGENVVGMYSPWKPKEDVIPGMNSLLQAGQGMHREPVQGSQIQDFPRGGRGTAGQPAENAPTPVLQRKGKPADYGLQIREQQLKDKQQKAIDNSNKSFNNALDTYKPLADEIIQDTDKAISLIEKGNIQFGLYGNILDTIPYGTNAMNKDTKEFVSTINDIVDKDSGFTKGVATNFKIKLKQAAKAHLGQDRETAINILNRIKSQKKKLTDLYDIRTELIEANGGDEPKHLGQLAEKVWKSREAPELPNDAQENDVYSDDKGQNWKVMNGELKRV